MHALLVNEHTSGSSSKLIKEIWKDSKSKSCPQAGEPTAEMLHMLKMEVNEQRREIHKMIKAKVDEMIKLHDEMSGKQKEK
jgi:hypothetical protein